MPDSDDRHPISREEIGILMSYATRPDRLTDEIIEKLENGVTRADLVAISTWLGLPKSTPTRLIEANAPRTSVRGQRGVLEVGFRRALIGILGAFLVWEAYFLIESDRSRMSVFYLVSVSALIVYFVYSLIVRVSST